jgi:hypothetical protein
MKTTTLITMIAVLAFACGEKQNATQNAALPTNAPTIQQPSAVQSQAQPGAVAQTAATQASAPAGTLAGTIVETMDSGGYTYMKLKTASGEHWVATQQTPVKKGQNVTVLAQMTAEKFHSSTLNRTFDTIVFGSLPAAAPVQSAAASPASMKMPPNHPATGAGPMGNAAQHMGGGAADIGAISVPKAEGANGHTVAELWADKASLRDKPVAVRGKVVKFLPGIMGRNWLHLRDGSGSADAGTHDITVTTTEGAAVGDTVVVNGLLRVDKDFGAGYKYGVIIEDGKVVK